MYSSVCCSCVCRSHRYAEYHVYLTVRNDPSSSVGAVRWKTDKRLQITGHDKTNWCIYAILHVPAVGIQSRESKVTDTEGWEREQEDEGRQTEHSSAKQTESTLQPKTKPCSPASHCGQRATDPQERCHSESLMPQLGVFSPFYISALGVYVGLSAGSFHPGTLELFTARRLQPFSGMRWVGESKGGERRKRRSETLVLEVLQTDTSLLMVGLIYQCACARFYVRFESMCFLPVWLIKAFGLSIRRDVCSRESGVLVTFHLHCWSSALQLLFTVSSVGEPSWSKYDP